MQRSPLRAIVGLFFCGFGGLSLTTAVLPFVVGKMFGLYSLDMMFAVRGYGIPIALVWAACGVVVGWYGGVSLAGPVLGGVGLLSGFVLGAFALEGDMSLILASAATGLLYGGIAGLILGKAFPKPEVEVE